MMAIRFILSFYICLISIYISGQQQKLDSLETYFNQFYTVEFVDANNENIMQASTTIAPSRHTAA